MFSDDLEYSSPIRPLLAMGSGSAPASLTILSRRYQSATEDDADPISW